MKHNQRKQKTTKIRANGYIHIAVIARYAVVLLCVLAAFIAYYFYSLNHINNTLVIDKVEQKQDVNDVENDINNIAVPVASKKTAFTEPSINANILSHLDIQLPQPPQLAQSAQLAQSPESSKSLELLKPNALKDEYVENHKINTSNPIVKTLTDTHLLREIPSNPSSTYQQVYEQITNEQNSDSNVVIELAWPSNKQQYQQVLRYFEQCLGMGFGVIEKGISLSVLQPLKDNEEFSSWLRVISDNLTVNEKHMMLKYKGLKHNSRYVEDNLLAVRLFPAWFDQALAQLISHELKGQPLTSFFAQFNVHAHLGQQKLTLEQPQINGNRIDSSWQLHKC